VTRRAHEDDPDQHEHEEVAAVRPEQPPEEQQPEGRQQQRIEQELLDDPEELQRPAPRVKTMTVWMNEYSASKPMTPGVRMRLPDTVWKTRLDTPTATPTTTRAPSWRERRLSA